MAWINRDRNDATVPRLWINETWICRDKNAQIGESGIYETWTGRRGALYHSLRKEYGRCIGRVYVDKTNGPSMAVGWVFLQRATYEGSKETYLRETWVTVHTAQADTTVTHHYADLGARA